MLGNVPRYLDSPVFVHTSILNTLGKDHQKKLMQKRLLPSGSPPAQQTPNIRVRKIIFQWNRWLDLRSHKSTVQERDMALFVEVNLLQIGIKRILEARVHKVHFCKIGEAAFIKGMS